MSSFKIGSPRVRKMLSLGRPGPLGGGTTVDRHVGPVQEDVTEHELDEFFGDPGMTTKMGYPTIPRLGSVQTTHGKCPCGGDIVVLQEPDNLGCALCGRRQLGVYDPKEQNKMDDMSKMTLGNEVANVTPTLPGVPGGTTDYPRQNPGP
jgi:hypothetical protein